ncbi:MAG: ABC transporter ATP-binding protein [Campylobacterales bacterium]|nr:ABC transporter ATP-binding protein [Campylobacterales bacterium]
MTQISIQTIIHKILEYKSELIKGNLIAIASTLMIVAIPLLIPMLVDELLLDKEKHLVAFIEQYIFETSLTGYVVIVLLMTLFLRLGGFLLSIWQTKVFLSISKKVSYFLRIKLLKYLKTVSLKEYEMLKSGSIASKLITDINTIDTFIGTTVSKFIISVLTLLFSAVVLLMIDWQLAIFILLTNPIVIFFTAKLSRNVGKLKKEENQATEKFQSALVDSLDIFSQIRATNKEDYFFDKIEDNARELREREIAFGYKSEAAMRLSFLIFLSGYELFRAVSILFVAYGDLSIGLMMAIFSYLWVMAPPTQDVINFQYTLKNAKEAIKRLNAILQMSQEKHIPNSLDPFDKPLGIEVKNLSFAYNEGDNILKNVSLTIKPKQNIALVGASGSGKTTLGNILVGFYPHESGEIYYNGVSSDKIDLRVIREHIYLILQNPKLFHDTLRFNLTLGKEHSDEAIHKALAIAQLSSVINKLEKGLDTMVGRDGIKLSGGQRQRVAIARMILANPSMVILDESTSALDIETESRLFDNLAPFMAQKTFITIAHRLSTIKSADYIYVLEHGEIIDQGTPSELMHKEGYFSGMV